jgi:hypothetical protein
MKILFATDGSKYSARALRSVATHPWPKCSEVKAISVPESFVAATVLPYFESTEIENLNTSAIKAAKESVGAGVRILANLDAKVSSVTAFPQDSPERVIVKEAQRWAPR